MVWLSLCHSNYHRCCASAAPQKAMQIYSRVNNLNALNRQVTEVHSCLLAFFSPSLLKASLDRAFVVWCEATSNRLLLLLSSRTTPHSVSQLTAFEGIAPLVPLVIVLGLFVFTIYCNPFTHHHSGWITDSPSVPHSFLSPTAIQLKTHFSTIRTHNRPFHDDWEVIEHKALYDVVQ